MITLRVNDQTFLIDGEELKNQILENSLPKLNEGMEKMGFMKGMISSSISSMFTVLQIQKPKELKEMDNIEFALRLALEQALSLSEEKGIEIKAIEVGDDGKTN